MIRIETILAQLGAQGVKFWLEGEALHYRAPRGALNVENLQVLRARKAEILDFLRAHAADAGAGTTLPPLLARGATSGPLSHGQLGLWVLYQLYGGNPAYNIPEALLLRGPLDMEALTKSLRLIARRHAVLRAAVRDDDGTASFAVAAEITVEIPVVDLIRIDDGERLDRAMQLVNREAHCIFDLRTGPLFKTCLIRLGDREHIFCFTLHHLIADGWSKGILSKELARSYNACRRGREPDFPPLPIDYLDFAHWQRQILTDALLEPHIRYWRETLANLPAPASLPTDRFRPAEPSGRGKVLVRELASDLSRAIKEQARDAGCTLYMALTTLFAELLRRYRNDSDIVFGTPSANRPFKELYDLLGFFVNSLVIRVAADGRLSFTELLARVRQTTLDAFAHQIVPFEKVVEALPGQRSQNFSPLFQIGFVLQDGAIEPPLLDGLQVEPILIERTTAKYDLSLIAVETGDRIVLEWEYATDLFDEATIHHLAASFARLAEEAMQRPAAALQSLCACDAAQRELVAGSWSRSHSVAVPDVCLQQLFAAAAGKYPDRPAVVCGDHHLSYHQLDQRSAAIALRLQREGVGPETIAAVCLGQSVDLIAAILGVLKAGGAYLPLDPSHPPGRLRTMLEDSEARVILAAGHSGMALPPGVTLVDPYRIPAAGGEVFQAERQVRPDNLAYLIYTSGSTGTPKGVMIEHRSVVNLLAGLDEAVYSRYPGPQQVSLFAAAVFDASVQQIFAALCGGHTLHVLEPAARDNAALLLDYWREAAVTVADGTPTLLRLLLEAGLAEAEGLALKQLIIGGEPLPYETMRKLRAGTFGRSLAVTNIYGPTECCVDVTALDCPVDGLPEQTVMPIGRPLANSETYILDDQGQPVPPGMPGELYLGGPSVGRGYLGRDDLTAERFIASPFAKGSPKGSRLYRTGDRVRFLSDGIIAFLGRTDNQVKIRGFRIELGEIEHCLRQCPMVRDAVVCAAGTEPQDRTLVAYLAVDDEGVSLEDLHRALEQRLPHYMIPGRFFTLASLPRNASGKVDRSALAALDLVALKKDSADFCPPRTEREKLLSSLWQEVLHIDPPGIDDNYFVLGGDSIKALQIVSRLRKHGCRLALKDIFQFPTIGRLAPRINEGSVAAVRLPAVGRVPLTAIQSWFFTQFKATPHHFHQAVLLHAKKRLDEAALRMSLQALLRHHDALRSRFVAAETGEWQQEVMAHDLPVRFVLVDCRRDPLALERLREHSFVTMNSTDLTAGPLFAAVLYHLDDGDRLLLTAHHLVVDAVSWRILLQDLHTAYRQSLVGGEIDLGAKTTSFKEWAERLAAHNFSLVPGRTMPGHGLSRSPYDDTQPFTYGERCRCSRLLSPDLSQSLHTDVHRAYRTGITDILVCAFGRAVQREAGIGRFAITLESHGREPLSDDIELDRTVGWFTAMHSMEIDCGSPEDIGGTIASAQAAIRRAQAIAGRPSPLPSILFNYLGDFDAELSSELFTRAAEKIGPVIDPRATVPFALEVTGMCFDGSMELAIEHGPSVEASRIATLMELWAAELQTLVDHAAAVAANGVPSTIDSAGLGIDEVHSFLNIFTGN